MRTDSTHASRVTLIHNPQPSTISGRRASDVLLASKVESSVIKADSGDGRSAKWIRSLLSKATIDESPSDTHKQTQHTVHDTTDPIIQSYVKSSYSRLPDEHSPDGFRDAPGHDGHQSTVDVFEKSTESDSLRAKQSNEEYRRKVSAAFTKGILDMEDLLNEALKVAQEVADEEGREVTLIAREHVQAGKSPSPEIKSCLTAGEGSDGVIKASGLNLGKSGDGQFSKSTTSDYSLVVNEAARSASDGVHSITRPVSRSASKRKAIEKQSVLAEIFGKDQVEPVKGESLQPDMPIHLKPIATKAVVKDCVRPLVRETRSASSPPTWRELQERPKFLRRGQHDRNLSRSSGEHYGPMLGLGKRSRDHHIEDGEEDTDTIYGRGWASGPPLSSHREDEEGTPELRPGSSAITTPTGRRERGRMSPFRAFSLRDRHHVDVRISRRFILSRTHRRRPISRDWGSFRKRYCATIACITTALIGLTIGIYAGEVPAIQYQVVDQHHVVMLGNVLLYLGLAITTGLFWALPLLHGRKPYTLLAFSVFLPLQLPQALVVTSQRSPDAHGYVAALLLSRTGSGMALGFANINLISTLLDLFGASLQSRHPHQEAYHVHDARHHGGGMGIWLSLWSWCYIGSIGVGFLLGAVISNGLNPSWGFWITIVLTATVLLLNVLIPEVRRSSFRRSVAEIRTETNDSRGGTITRRVARGEIALHVFATGPKWWWEEVHASLVLSGRMLSQRGFVILVLYLGWVYAQIVMVVILLGALTSKYYGFRSDQVGACVTAIPIGALLAVPFEKASIFSRSRRTAPRTDSMTFEKRVTWSSHLVRRALFMISLPFADLAYTLTSKGPPTHFMWPTFFAGLIGFLSNLAIAECIGLIMETYDTSDLQPGMTGTRARARQDGRSGGSRARHDPRRTTFSCFPRVTSGLVLVQTCGFVIAAAATGVGGAVERQIGAELATGLIAVILLILSLALTAVLWRYREMQVVPNASKMEVDKLGELGPGGGGGGGGEEPWMPVIIGNPSGRTRRMSVLETGSMTRWTEIRKRNRLGDNAMDTGSPVVGRGQSEGRRTFVSDQ